MSQHDDVRAVDGVYELFQNDRQITIGGDAIVFTDEDAAALRDALYEETSFGERYVFNAANFAILSRVSEKLNRHTTLPTAITKTRVFEAFSLVDQAGGLTEFGNLERVPVEVVAPVARNDRGQFANSLLAEYHAMLADPAVHSSAITKRMNTDRAFREAVEAEGKTNPTTAPAAGADMRTFALAYRQALSIRPLNGRITLGNADYTVAEFNALVEEASRLRLL
jgi:hypothetical protein